MASRLARAWAAFLARRRGQALGRAEADLEAYLERDRQDLIQEHRPTDPADEYRRRAVERALAACPYHL